MLPHALIARQSVAGIEPRRHRQAADHDVRRELIADDAPQNAIEAPGRAASLRSGPAHDRSVETHEPPRAVRFHARRSTAHDSRVPFALLGVYVVR